MLSKEAKTRQGERNDLKESNISPKWGESSEIGKAVENLSKESGISPRTIERYNYVSKNIDEEDLNKLCNGELDDDGIKRSIVLFFSSVNLISTANFSQTFPICSKTSLFAHI